MRNCASWLADAALRASHAPRNDDCCWSLLQIDMIRTSETLLLPHSTNLRRRTDTSSSKMSSRGCRDLKLAGVCIEHGLRTDRDGFRVLSMSNRQTAQYRNAEMAKMIAKHV
jgi:hypothetical protein